MLYSLMVQTVRTVLGISGSVEAGRAGRHKGSRQTARAKTAADGLNRSQLQVAGEHDDEHQRG